MRSSSLLVALVLVAACSNITATEEGVTSLVLLVPSPAEVEAGQTIPLYARPINQDRDTVDVPVYWRALDTTIVVDSTEGLLTGVIAGKTGRVVAHVGNLYSDPITFSVLFRADTLIRIAPAEDTVTATETTSGVLTIRLETTHPPAPVASRRVFYEVVQPTFASPEDRTVEFEDGSLLRGVTTSSTGEPSPTIRLRRRSGQTQPDFALVEVNAWRPGGEPIPGSGVQFTIRFEKP